MWLLDAAVISLSEAVLFELACICLPLKGRQFVRCHRDDTLPAALLEDVLDFSHWMLEYFLLAHARH